MFSSLETLPADTGINHNNNNNNNYTTEWTEWEVQVTRNGATGQIITNGKPHLHKMATPIVVETQTDNEDDCQTIDKLTVNTEIEISEVMEEQEEYEEEEEEEEEEKEEKEEERVKEENNKDTNRKNTSKKPPNDEDICMHNKEDEEENNIEQQPRIVTDHLVMKQNEKEEEIQKEQVKMVQEVIKLTNGRAASQDTPAIPIMGSRYDKVYRRKERPFGATYRRREQQLKEKQRQQTTADEYRRRQHTTHVENKEEDDEDDEGEEERQEKENGEEKEKAVEVQETTPPPAQESCYYEDEYCYEPEKKMSTSKTVLRTRSMINLDIDDNSKPFVRKTMSDVIDCGNHVTNSNGIVNGSSHRGSNGVDAKFRYLNGYNSKSITNISTLPPSASHHSRSRPVSLRQISSSTTSLGDVRANNEDEDDENDKEVVRRKLRQLLANDRLVIEPRRNTALDTATLRRCFYHPVRTNRELIDEELPDPDQVKLARDKFEKVLKIRGPEAPKQLTLTRTASEKRVTPEVRVPPPAAPTTPKWTDTASQSSGVSSGGEGDGELEDDDDPLHEVSTEILNRIRACGTTVTYYGGKVISQSSGPPSPLTSTIMEEIKFRLEVRDRMQLQEGFTNCSH